MPRLGRIAHNYLFGGAPSRVRMYVVLLIHARERGWARWAHFLEGRLQRKYSVFLSRKAHFSRSLDLKHPVGIVVGEGVRLGDNVTLYQHVTLGGARRGDMDAGNYPVIGDGTTIFAGAVVVGNVRVGNHCVIGANAVVTRDVPDYATAVGVPARVVRRSAQVEENRLELDV